jgi:hypothetical protein
MASNRPGFYRSEVGYPFPNFLPKSGLKKSPISPKMGKISINRHKNQLKIPKTYK